MISINMINALYVFCVIFHILFAGCHGLDNIALNKTFTMLSTARGFKGKEGRAVDGNRNQNIDNCTHTDPSSGTKTKGTFVYVDLGSTANIYNVTIYYRKDYERRLNGYALYYSEEFKREQWKLCYKDHPISDKPKAIVSHTCKDRARFVIIYQDNISGNDRAPILEICEIEILGCNSKQFNNGTECVNCPGTSCAECDPDGKCLECMNQEYRDDCETFCPESCIGECDLSTGQCKKCPIQTYGDHCEKNCSESCVGGCNISTGHCEKCSSHQYGIFCNDICGQCLDVFNKDSCDDVNGTCAYGCEKGFTGRLCKEGCNSTSFGYNCNQTCSGTCEFTPGSRQCHSSTGHCTSCLAGKRGGHCNEECMAMTYGKNCSLKCGHCLIRSGCDSVSGACVGGCDPGYQGFYCNETCSDKTFGGNCSEMCGHCRNGTACDPFSGYCNTGCDSGYQGMTCTETCGLCRNNTDCDQFNGTCFDGCQEGHQGDICSETCNIGYYGEDCNYTCNEHCTESTSMTACHHVTGECLIGCKEGWTGKYCETACSNGTFGKNCAWKCNEWCAGESQMCDPRDGICIYGCIPGFGGSHCNMYCDEGSYGERCSKSCGKCFLKDCHHMTGHCANSEPLCMDGYRGEKCDTECDPCTFGPDCRHNCSDGCFDGECLLESREIENGTSHEDSKEFKDFLPIFGVGLSAFLTILTIITAYGIGRCCTRPKRRPRKRNSQLGMLAVEISDEFNTMDLSESMLTEKTEIPVKDLQRVIEEKTRDDCSVFRTEFSALKSGKLRAYKKENPPESGPKKRYSRFSRYSVISFSEDYYKVLMPNDTGNGESLNASYIRNVEGKIAYIAAEVNHTIPVWEMIWMKNISKIVMLSKGLDCENECAPYWPEVGQSQTFQPYVVVTKERRDYACYSLYFLILRKDNLEREILLFHYHSWQEEDDVIPVDFINFYFRVARFPINTSGSPGPLLVQCSDVLGKTGVYIALDALYNYGLSNKKMNVLQYVQTIRQCRQNMIQSLTQYILLHHLLAEAFLNAYNPLPRKYYLLENVEHDAVSTMFSAIEGKRPTYKLGDYTKAFRNMDLVSNINVLPLDRFYFPLGDKMESYKTLFTNSIAVPSYLSQNRFIMSQLPLTFNMDNAITVISKIYCRVIVLIGPRDETKEVTQTLFDESSTRAVVNTSKVLNKTSISETFCLTELLIQNKEEDGEHSLSICEISSWPIKYPDNGAYTDMLKVVTIILESDPMTPIILLSGDGASGCDVLCTVHNCMEQIFLDGEVDVSASIHQLQTRRPEFLATKEDLKICLDVFRKGLATIKKK